jgi:hypothetical protein
MAFWKTQRKVRGRDHTRPKIVGGARRVEGLPSPVTERSKRVCSGRREKVRELEGKLDGAKNKTTIIVA